jgi:prephenate dehydrogenase
VEKALAKKAISYGTIEPESVLGECDVLIACLYPSALASWIEQYQHAFKPGMLVMEISGVKSNVLKQIEPVLQPQTRFLSVHPMCGRESKGIEHASARIFDRSNFLIIEEERTLEDDMQWAEKFAKELGCARISRLGAKKHDEMIAFLSQLTHVIAVCLMNANDDISLSRYSGDSFRDLTRIADINATMWAELFLQNKEVLLDQIGSFENAMKAFRTALENEDREGMEEMMRTSKARRENFVKTDGKTS